MFVYVEGVILRDFRRKENETFYISDLSSFESFEKTGLTQLSTVLRWIWGVRSIVFISTLNGQFIKW